MTQSIAKKREAVTFWTASRDGDLPEVKHFLDTGSRVNDRETTGGMTALHYAAQSKSPELVKYLIGSGAEVNARANGGVTPLMLSVDQTFGQPDIALLLVMAGADATAADSNGDTALLIATTESSTEVMQALLDHGANPNATGLGGETALHYAALNGMAERVELLIRYHADPTIRDSAGRSATDLAETAAPKAVARTNNEIEVKENFGRTRDLLRAAPHNHR